jgi:hypothetical protein
MARKRWTPQTEITDTLVKTREKKKWQLGLRRYVLEKTPSEQYAPYFGLDIETLRSWFAIQFTADMNWDNFGPVWQFGHIVPISCFDFSLDADLRLCWHFTNLRAESIQSDSENLLSARLYYQSLLDETGLPICRQMLEKLALLEKQGQILHTAQTAFIQKNRALLDKSAGLTQEEMRRINTGEDLDTVLLEREILRKFGGGPEH